MNCAVVNQTGSLITQYTPDERHTGDFATAVVSDRSGNSFVLWLEEEVAGIPSLRLQQYAAVAR